MILVINTIKNKQAAAELEAKLKEKDKTYKVMDAAEMKISHCIGCNFCWLKTPGECSIKDDHEQILREVVKAEQVWIISDVTLGFVSPLAKNIVDRMIPIATMLLKFKNGQMRHVMRYDRKGYDFGVIISGDADMDHLKRWSERVAINFDGKSRGVFSTEEITEAVSCM